ncbi:uncharacterized protein G2W53_012068 [Senna tora]|uniref:Uncharacterized protein n=1 Tax=Senna tora TaxID=362788 RepID=A0A834U0Y0_9FABA|nr:uncharacterized protein G2W53_012068 [Senna tora]
MARLTLPLRYPKMVPVLPLSFTIALPLRGLPKTPTILQPELNINGNNLNTFKTPPPLQNLLRFSPELCRSSFCASHVVLLGSTSTLISSFLRWEDFYHSHSLEMGGFLLGLSVDVTLEVFTACSGFLYKTENFLNGSLLDPLPSDALRNNKKSLNLHFLELLLELDDDSDSSFFL